MIHEKAPIPTRNLVTQEFQHFTLFKQTPENSTHNIPVLIVPGFASSAASYQLLADTLDKAGFITIRIQYKFGEKEEPKKLLMFPDVSTIKQQAIIEAIQAEGYVDQDGVKK